MALIKDYAKQIRGVSYKPDDLHTILNTGSITLLRANNIDDGVLNLDDVVYVDRSCVKEDQKLKKGDVLICASSGSKNLVGKAAYISDDLDMTFGAFCKVVRPHDINTSFFQYFFQSPSYRQRISALSAGANINNIRNEHIDEMSFHVPDIATQRRIAATLDKVSEGIALCKQMLVDLEELVKSRFVELFDGKGYPTLKWNDVFNITTGKLDSNAMVENGEFPFFTCAKEVFRIDKYAFDQEALLLAGNNAAGKYDVKYYKGKFNAYQRTYVLGLKENWSYQLFRYQLEDKLVYLQQQSLGGLTKYLTLKILGELEFVVPPMDKQNEFTTFVEQTGKSKYAVQQQLAELETLKKSLMQEYFG